VAGIVSDKEHAQVAAVRKVFPGVHISIARPTFRTSRKTIGAGLAELAKGVEKVAKEASDLKKALESSKDKTHPQERESSENFAKQSGSSARLGCKPNLGKFPRSVHRVSDLIARVQPSSAFSAQWRRATDGFLARQCAIDRRSRNRKDFRQITYRVISGIVHSAQLSLLFFGELGLFAPQLPLARAMAIPSRVRRRIKSPSNSAKVARMLKNILPIGPSGHRC